MKKPKITFFMMAFNTEKYIAKAIESILNQKENNIVLWIRNNGSTDSTGEIIKKFASKDSRVHFVENKYNGITNEGIKAFSEGWWPFTEETAGEYFSIVDSDDWLDPNFASDMYNAAKENDADMTVCGNYFVNEATGNITSKRVPPPIQTKSMDNIGTKYLEFYNCMRTWWGKLFKKDFFIRNYKECWSDLQPLLSTFDTCIILKYWEKCDVFVSIDKPLYFFLNRNTSTYNTKPFSTLTLIEANNLYSSGLKILNQFKINNSQNKAIESSLHLSYIIEGVKGVFSNNIQHTLSPYVKILQLECFVNDNTLGRYLYGNFFSVYKSIEDLISKIMKDDHGFDTVWKSFLARLYYSVNHFVKGQKNVLLFPFLVSCLSDRRNKNLFGLDLLADKGKLLEEQKLSKGEKWFLNKSTDVQISKLNDIETLITEINFYDISEDLFEEEALLIKSFETGDYETTCNLLEIVSQKSPFNRIAMHYRIKLAMRFKLWDVLPILAASASNLWPYECEIQTVTQEAESLIYERNKELKNKGGSL